MLIWRYIMLDSVASYGWVAGRAWVAAMFSQKGLKAVVMALPCPEMSKITGFCLRYISRNNVTYRSSRREAVLSTKKMATLDRTSSPSIRPTYRVVHDTPQAFVGDLQLPRDRQHRHLLDERHDCLF